MTQEASETPRTRRVGIIRFNREEFNRWPLLLSATGFEHLFDGMLVMAIQEDVCRDEVMYKCYGEMFDPVEEGMLVPEYTMEIEQYEDNGVRMIRVASICRNEEVSPTPKTGYLPLRPKWIEQDDEVLAGQLYRLWQYGYKSRGIVLGEHPKTAEIRPRVWIDLARTLKRCEELLLPTMPIA